MRSDFILSNKQRGKKCSEDRFTLKWMTNPTSAITSPLTHIQSSLHGSMWVDVRVRACASDSPPADVAAQFSPAPRAFIASSSAFLFFIFFYLITACRIGRRRGRPPKSQLSVCGQ